MPIILPDTEPTPPIRTRQTTPEDCSVAIQSIFRRRAQALRWAEAESPVSEIPCRKHGFGSVRPYTPRKEDNRQSELTKTEYERHFGALAIPD